MRLSGLYHHPSLRQLLWLSAAASLSMLAAALVAQYVFYLAPCELCIAQRYPYAAVAAIGMLLPRFASSTRLLRAGVWACGLLFLADAGIALYHTAVEAGWIVTPSGCASDTSVEGTIEEMRRQILMAPLVTCDQPMTHILGISLAGWNAIAALSFALALAVQYRKAVR